MLVVAATLLVTGAAAVASPENGKNRDLEGVLENLQTELEQPPEKFFEVQDVIIETVDEALVFEGALVNVTDAYKRSAPAIEIVYMDGDGNTLGTRVIRPVIRTIAAGKQASFAYIEASPPKGVQHADLQIAGGTDVTPQDPNWVDLPDRVRGLWADDCKAPEMTLLLSGFGILELTDNEFGSDYWIGARRFTALVPGDQESFRYQTTESTRAQSMTVTGDELRLTTRDVTWTRCTAVPADLAALHGEAINGGLALDRAIATCRNDEATCPGRLMSFADVSGNGELSVAEISRVLRIGMYYGSVFGEDNVNRTNELTGRTLAMHAAAPLVVELFMSSMDYDDNGQLSMAELGQDRGSLSSMNVDRVRAALPDQAEITKITERLKGLFRILR
jgi:hypothetical protein